MQTATGKTDPPAMSITIPAVDAIFSFRARLHGWMSMLSGRNKLSQPVCKSIGEKSHIAIKWQVLKTPNPYFPASGLSACLSG
jgi:hypothetical protein